MATSRVLIAELDFDTTALIKSAESAQLALDQLKASQIALGVRTEENTKQFIENEIAQKKVRAELTEHKKVLTSLTDAQGKQVDTTSKMNDELGREVKSISDARNSNKELTAIRNKLNLTTKEGRDALVAVNTKLDENNKFIKDNADAYTKQKIGIGNYEGALRSVFPQLSGVIEQVKNVKDGLIAQSAVMKAGIVTTGGLSGALKILKVALISTGIGAIVVVLGSLIAFLMSTQAGIDAVTSVTRPLQAVFKSMLGVIQNLGQSMFEAFTKPKVLLKDLMDFLQGQVVNRLKSFKVIMDGILERDTKKITNGLLQLSTGVTNMTDKVAKGAEKAGKFLSDSAKKGAEIDRLTKEIEKSTLKYNAAQIKVNDELDKQLLISKDTSRSFAEREAASRRIIEISKQNGIEEAKIIQMEINRLAIEQSLNDTKRTGQQEMIALQTRLDDAKDRSVEAEKEQLRVLAGARKEAQKEQLDALKTIQDAKDKSVKDEEDKKTKKNEAEKKELDRIRDFEDKKRQLINEIDLQNATTEDEKQLLKLFQDQESQLLELERIEVTETEKGELRKLIIERNQNEINELLQQKAEEMHEKVSAIRQQEVELEQTIAQSKLDIAQMYASTLLGILGKGLAGQLASIALNAIIEVAKLKIATAAAVQQNLAIAASYGPPQNIPAMLLASKQNALIMAGAKIAQTKITTGAVLSGVGAIAGNLKFASGGLMEIGGNRHASGGTKFIGEDGTSFEAERGELIGVMSRTASEQFMKFNNQFTRGNTKQNYFASGGIATRQNGSIVRDIIEAMQNIPTPIVDVKDIITEVNNRISLVDRANR